MSDDHSAQRPDGDAREPDPAALAWEVGASDAFVFVRSRSGHFVHRGGCGRGEDWAGNVEIALDAEPLLSAALHDDAVIQVRDDHSRRIVGPYYATSAALIPVNDGAAVVLGTRDADGGEIGGPAAADEQTLRDVARRILVQRPGATPAKILADELEVLSAVQSVTRALDLPFTAALEHLATVASGALGCQLAVAATARGELAVADNGGAFTGDRAKIAAAIAASFAGAKDALCVQDASERPICGLDGVRSYLALPIGAPVGGTLVVMHTDVDPRGFTTLCRRISDQLMEAGSVLLQVAALRHELLEQVERTSKEARHDVLTGVANRLKWEEAISDAQRGVMEGHQATILLADLDCLKYANDHHGHDSGDRLISALAHALERCVRLSQDVVARLGGDEFGVLLPGVGADIAASKLAKVRAEVAGSTSEDGLPVLASIGMATCEPYGSLARAWRQADAQMYADKRARKAAHDGHCAPLVPPEAGLVAHDDVVDDGAQGDSASTGFDAGHFCTEG